jgi:tRNA(Ile)-lysidine synthetase-like protein
MNIFINEWLNNSKWWFSKTEKIDNYIINKYSYLLDLEANITRENFLSYIVLYDQLPRHIFRNQDANHIILYFLNKSIDIINNYKNQINNLNEIEWIFFMLPLRHTNIKDNILYVLNEAWNNKLLNNKLLNNNKSLLKEFIIATYKKANFGEELNEKISLTFKNDILDYNPLQIQKINLNFQNNDLINLNYNLIDKYVKKIGIISLSGGVDSMVCLVYCMTIYPDINWVCVHINYKNREVADDEADFIANFCYKHNIKLYVREINEINRNKCMSSDINININININMREIYEDYTRKIRFNTYKAVCNFPVVILGHNKDDALENILTNITYNCKYKNLKGMEEHCVCDNITFLRPLLNVSKNDIYQFAHKHNIPYVKNSTPEWSQRGKIRNNIVPVLDNWDKRVLPGLFNLSENIQDMYSIMESNVNIIINKFRLNNNSYELDLSHNEFINYLHKLIWKEIIYKLFNCYPSNKSLITLIERLNLWLKQKKHTTIVINKNIIMKITQLTNNINIILLKKN